MKQHPPQRSSALSNLTADRTRRSGHEAAWEVREEVALTGSLRWRRRPESNRCTRLCSHRKCPARSCKSPVQSPCRPRRTPTRTRRGHSAEPFGSSSALRCAVTCDQTATSTCSLSSPHRTPGLLEIAQLELHLGELLGRSVDLRTLGDLSQYFRNEVAAEARTLYDAA